MRRYNGQRGEGRLGLLVALVVLGSAAFVAAKIIPVRVKAYEFHDFITQECRWGAVRTADEEVVQRIIEKAKSLDLPLEKENLKVERTRLEMTIAAKYDQPIDLKVTTYVYHFDHKERAPLF